MTPEHTNYDAQLLCTCICFSTESDDPEKKIANLTERGQTLFFGLIQLAVAGSSLFFLFSPLTARGDHEQQSYGWRYFKLSF